MASNPRLASPDRVNVRVSDHLRRNLGGVVPRGYHTHKCGGCGVEWLHMNEVGLLADHHTFVVAHSCPRCGERQTWKSKIAGDRL